MNLFTTIRGVLCGLQFKLWRSYRFKRNHTGRVLFLNIDESVLHRYILCNSNLLNQRDCVIQTILPLNLSLLAELHKGRNWKPYEIALLNSEFFLWEWPLKDRPWKQVSSNYFAQRVKEKTFRVPIGPHPLFWKWEHPDPSVKKSKDFFFAGAIHDGYNAFDEEIWQMPNRIRTFEYLLHAFPSQFTKKRKPQEAYLRMLKEHHFFIGLPGVCMPLCHNIYEAIYFQCTPLLHANTLQYIDKKLQAIIEPYCWNSLANLQDILISIQKGTYKPHYTRLQIELEAYWQSELTPEALFRKIELADSILICAEEKSVSLISN